MLQSTLPKEGKSSQTTVTILGSLAKLPLYFSEIVAILFWPDLTALRKNPERSKPECNLPESGLA